MDCKVHVILLLQKGRLIETITVVLDFENMSVERHYYWPGIDSMRAVLRQVEGNTPECMKHVFVLKGNVILCAIYTLQSWVMPCLSALILAPSFFPVAYGLVKGFLDEKTRRKIHVLGSEFCQDKLVASLSFIRLNCHRELARRASEVHPPRPAASSLRREPLRTRPTVHSLCEPASLHTSHSLSPDPELYMSLLPSSTQAMTYRSSTTAPT